MPTYSNAQYVNGISGINTGISVLINGVQSWVPISTDNTDYNNIMYLVSQGQLTIAPAS